MENSISSHDYSCSSSQEIPHLLENPKGDDNYKRITWKCEHNIHSINVPAKLSVYFVGDCNVQKNSPLTLIKSPPQKSNPLIQLLSNTDFNIIFLSLPSGSSSSGFLSQLYIPFFFTICMLHIFHLLSHDYIRNSLWTVTDMKLTTESSAPLYSYLPLTPNIFLTTLLSQFLNLYSSLDILFSWHNTPNFIPTQNERKNVSFMSTHNILNWMVASIAWIHLALFFPRSWSFSNFLKT